MPETSTSLTTIICAGRACTHRGSPSHRLSESRGRQNSFHEQRVEDEEQKERQKREQRLIDVGVTQLVPGAGSERCQLGLYKHLRRVGRAVIICWRRSLNDDVFEELGQSDETSGNTDD